MIQIFNSLTNELEPFEPIKAGEVSLYVCGPTVYNYMHIGNARPAVIFDAVATFLRASGLQVTYYSNITDVDDKIITKAAAENKSEADLTDFYMKAYHNDCQNLQISSVNKYLVATHYIEEMVTFITQLIDRNIAYEIDGTVYFAIDRVAEYALLSHQNIEQLHIGARIEANIDKHAAIDFVLWKKTDVGIRWSSPWSTGRPGWHTECVAMILDEFGGPIDIHGGGMDLKFPHHDNEVAQAQGCGHPYLAKYWMHNGFVEINQEKMAKSSGNFLLTKDAIATYGAAAVRYWLLSVHYRQPLAFTDEILEESAQIVRKMRASFEDAWVQIKLASYVIKKELTSEIVNEQRQQFEHALQTDFNTANALTVLQHVIKQLNVHIRQGAKSLSVLSEYVCLVEQIDDILKLTICSKPEVTEEDRQLVDTWRSALQARQYEIADRYRQQLELRSIRVR